MTSQAGPFFAGPAPTKTTPFDVLYVRFLVHVAGRTDRCATSAHFRPHLVRIRADLLQIGGKKLGSGRHRTVHLARFEVRDASSFVIFYRH